MSENKKLPMNPNLVVEGFNPEEYVQEYTNTQGEKLTRLPFNAQLHWFQLKYPEGKIAVETRPGKGIIIAKARIYADRKDPIEAYIAEGESSRGPSPDMPSVNPRNWAQTAAISTALRYAGFGIECDLSGDEPETITGEWDSLMEESAPAVAKAPTKAAPKTAKAVIDNSVEDAGEGVPEGTNAPVEPAIPEGTTNIPDYSSMSDDEAVQAASKVIVDKGKHKGKTVAEAVASNSRWAAYVLEKFDENDPIRKAVEVLNNYAMRMAD